MPKTNGCVKWYHTKKGYGFISSLKDEKDYFVHISGIQLTDGKDGFKTLKQGEYVEFNINKEDGKEFAVDVTGIKGGKLLCEHRPVRKSNNSKKN